MSPSDGSTSPQGGDSLLDIMGEIEAAAQALQASLRPLVDDVTAARERRAAGASVPELVDWLIAAGGRDDRLRVGEAIRRYERAVMLFRAGSVRALIDGHGISLAEVARRMRISRQMAARLYAQTAAKV